jgi:hypothetical protein
MNPTLLHLFAFATLGVTLVSAQPTPSPAPATPPQPRPACTAPEHRQFDFWLGSWTVRLPDGDKTVGTSQISRASGNCAILEQWIGARGIPGMSINYYDAATRHWNQLWVGGNGTILKLEGGLENGAMVLSGVGRESGQDKPTMNRITWTPIPEGKVKQEWATSSDDGQTWKTVFVGIYSRAAETETRRHL